MHRNSHIIPGPAVDFPLLDFRWLYALFDFALPNVAKATSLTVRMSSLMTSIRQCTTSHALVLVRCVTLVHSPVCLSMVCARAQCDHQVRSQYVFLAIPRFALSFPSPHPPFSSTLIKWMTVAFSKSKASLCITTKSQSVTCSTYYWVQRAADIKWPSALDILDMGLDILLTLDRLFHHKLAHVYEERRATHI